MILPCTAAFKQPGSAGAAVSLTAADQPDTKRRRLDSEPLLLPPPRQEEDTHGAAAHRVAGSLPEGPALTAGGADPPAAPGLRGTGGTSGWGTAGLGSLGVLEATTGTTSAAFGQKIPPGSSLRTGEQQQQQQQVMCSGAVYPFPASLAQVPHASVPLQQQLYNVCMPLPQQHLSPRQWTPAQYQYHQQVGARPLPPSSAVQPPSRQQHHPQNFPGPVHRGRAPGLHHAAQFRGISSPPISSLCNNPQQAKQSAAQGRELSPALGEVVGGSACDRTEAPSPAHPSPMERLLGMQQTPMSHASS